MSSHFHLWKICFPYLAEIKVVSRCHKCENKFKNDVSAERLCINSVTDILKTGHIFAPCSIASLSSFFISSTTLCEFWLAQLSIASNKLNFKIKNYSHLLPCNQEKL
jgi:hypothetical protein